MLEHEPYLQVTWRDTLTPARGFVVIDQLVTGIATGGLRMRPGCTVDEVAELAREMTLKMGAFGIHVGGAKGGIDFDSTDPRAEEVRERFLQAVRPLLERFWVTAGDLGTQQEQLDQAFARVGIDETSFHAAVVRSPVADDVRARIRQAFATRTEGLKLSELVGGFGVAEAALAALDHQSIPAATANAVVQGFGAMGGSTALYLARAGVKIVGITDARGLILNTSRGLDVDLLLAARSTGGIIDRSVLRDDDVEAPGDSWLSQDVDLLVPAAVSYAITAENCDRIRGTLVVEAANVPTTPEAEQLLLDRGVTVVPDFIANTGAAAGAWWVILGEVVSPAGACSRLSSEIRPLVRGLMTRAEETGTSMRSAGVQFARKNSQRMIRENGAAVAFRDLFTVTPPQERHIGDGYGEPAADFPPSSDITEAVIHAPNGAASDLAGSSRESGRQPAAAFPAYWPGPDDPASGRS
ncbi:Glu/Leu/Phe/Val dehydrogenase dimerization domain-containing protein [Streptomyces meridianus]|uniref:Glutamate dehydrogenase n=1 Tax=Streptomyces meridianus TaxID=2938945 RepID=A0ABT0X7N8_9ACTN|nr:Glu/Leu/Phe/Val dehydrogenase dimerization domain-containing protein [Streptomyces meridianus]MCM2577789.1 glutamate dehydrogenase [Streptomyces meridianus]